MADPHPSIAVLSESVAVLRSGGLVAFPTETVYGLGADATLPDAVARIFAVKGRPQFNPLIAHVGSHEAATAEGLFTSEADALAAAFWPGPLTLVLPRRPGSQVCDLACAGLDSIGVRVPDHPIPALLLDLLRRPIVAPSANRSGRISPTEALHVAVDLGDDVDRILDGGPCAVGIESTIVACLRGRVRLLRPGGLDAEAIETIIGRPLDRAADEPAVGSKVLAPGLLASHYAPRARLRLDARDIVAGELGLDFGGTLAHATLDLSPSGDLHEAAASLYRSLRALDALEPRGIAVAPIPATPSLGAAIMDRLTRAAAPRD